MIEAMLDKMLPVFIAFGDKAKKKRLEHIETVADVKLQVRHFVGLWG